MHSRYTSRRVDVPYYNPLYEQDFSGRTHGGVVALHGRGEHFPRGACRARRSTTSLQALPGGLQTGHYSITYCVTCHNERLKTGGLALDSVDLADVAAARRRVGEGRPQGARRHDAAAGRAAARRGRARRRSSSSLDGVARSRGAARRRTRAARWSTA